MNKLYPFVFLLLTSYAHSDTGGMRINAAALSGEDTEKLMTKSALKSFPKYKSAGQHKAFAQSQTGKWAWVSFRTSVEYAKENALAQCQSKNKKHEQTHPCKVINVDGQWLN